MKNSRAIFALNKMLLPLHSTALCQPPLRQDKTNIKPRLAFPSKNWALDIELPSTTQLFENMSDDRRERTLAIWPEEKFTFPTHT